ncbi:glycosyltransferase [Gordonibacter massiliensis (ex Traore et al. 2017)]|uniref:Glycosyltransferase family 4 protein n=1 Tax=Gordonibacter massiliensis (ex Traore et al. 2017) TaxID=1841863 RepID=A0A842JE09_9ACTN|nr:glycosyltransferase [Gordonibacter massiliensis (ex Traore et al. 2017)]MBC2889917.1 glycosyltransferase family 4 protein [Gordonibacter massiliensis (ex Traore et al. 2017)]
MRILHCCLANFYIDGYGYQENILPRHNKADGHTVKILASTETYIDNQVLGCVEPGTYVNEDGIEVTRVPYRQFLPRSLMRRLRYYQGVRQFLESFEPDVILYHGNGGHGIVEVVGYCSKNPNVALYVDSHESFANSGRNPLSRHVLHGFINRIWIQQSLPSIKKMLCVAPECYPFLEKLYRIPEDLMELYPLGGEILPREEHFALRSSVRDKLAFSSDDIVLLHTGKLNTQKNTALLLDAFSQVEDLTAFKLLIVGSSAPDVESQIMKAKSADERISYIGWLPSARLQECFHAADIYMQPGTASVSFQQSLCAGCAGAARSAHSYPEFFGDAYWPINSVEDIVLLLRDIARTPRILDDKKNRCFAFAKSRLDYSELAKRLYR